MDCLKSVSKTFHYFNRFMLPIGFGARTLIGKKEGPASNLFSMTGDFLDPYVETHEELINCYEGTIKSVQLALPVLYQQVLKFVCDIAQNEMSKSDGVNGLKNYFVLIILMAGMIDDFQDTLNEMLKAANLPVSIIVINIGKNTEENDSEKFIKKAFPAFQKSERVYVDLLDFESYKNEQSQHTFFYQQQFQYDLIQNIPKHVEKFFEINNYESELDLDATSNLNRVMERSYTIVGSRNESRQSTKVGDSSFEEVRAKSQSEYKPKGKKNFFFSTSETLPNEEKTLELVDSQEEDNLSLISESNFDT